jgi:hypothetical protein
VGLTGARPRVIRRVGSTGASVGEISAGMGSTLAPRSFRNARARLGQPTAIIAGSIVCKNANVMSLERPQGYDSGAYAGTCEVHVSDSTEPGPPVAQASLKVRSPISKRWLSVVVFAWAVAVPCLWPVIAVLLPWPTLGRRGNEDPEQGIVQVHVIALAVAAVLTLGVSIRFRRRRREVVLGGLLAFILCVPSVPVYSELLVIVIRALWVATSVGTTGR